MRCYSLSNTRLFECIRFILLQKRPTLLKFLCAVVVFVGLIFSLMPTITGLDKGAAEAREQYMQQPKADRILWPLIFMFGFVSHDSVHVYMQCNAQCRLGQLLIFMLGFISHSFIDECMVQVSFFTNKYHSLYTL